MLDAKFIVNLTHLLRNGSSGFYQEFLFKTEVNDEHGNIFLYHGMKILEVNSKYIITKIIVEQYDKDLKNIGHQSIDYKFSVNKMVKICKKQELAKNYLELQFVDLYLNLYLKQIHSKNFNQKDLFIINEKEDANALVINKTEEMTEEQAQELLLKQVQENFKQGEQND